MDDYYEQWKPLRNALAKLDLNDTLSVIRAYSGWESLIEKPAFPINMEVNPVVYRNPTVILPWEMEILAREAIIVCENQSATMPTARRWNTFIGLVNKLRALDDDTVKEWLNERNILQEFSVRLAHQQSKYQEKPSKLGLIRYYKIFSHPKVAPVVMTKIDLSPKQIFTLGSALWYLYANTNFGMYYPLEGLDIPGITQQDYDKFMQLYSLPLEELKTKLLSRKLDDTFKYQYHALQSYPMILTRLNERLAHVCPIPTLLFWRITAGLYYDLVKEKGFDQAFGASFQDYIGDLLRTTFRNDSGNKVYSEEPDIRPKRCDWIVSQDNSFMLIECKTKRMTLGARTTIKDDKELFAQLEVIGEAITQAYQALDAYKNHAYNPQQYPFDTNKRPFICVVTLESWYLMGNQSTMLLEIVKERLGRCGLSSELVKEAPYIVMSVGDMEQFAYLAKDHDIADIIDPYWNDPEFTGWEFNSYVYKRFGDEATDYEYVFNDDLKDVFTV